MPAAAAAQASVSVPSGPAGSERPIDIVDGPAPSAHAAAESQDTVEPAVLFGAGFEPTMGITFI